MRRSITALLLALAVACHRDEPMADGKPLSHWKKEATKVSLFTFWNSDKDQRRREAFRRLSEMGEPAVPALVDLFREKRNPISGDAFNVLANLGPRSAGAVPDLIRILNGDKPELRRRAAWILGKIGPAAEPAVPSLTRMLNEPDQRMRQAAAEALGQIGGSGHVALERARESNDPQLREASMRGTAARPLDPAARREYVASGLADPQPDVRLRALDLLMTAKADEAEALADYLVKALNDPDPRVNEAAHTVFNVYLQHGGATPVLLATVLKGGDAAARADAAWHLGHHMIDRVRIDDRPVDASVIDALLAALDAQESKVRIYAARALAHAEGRTREQGLEVLRREMPNAEPILAVRAARVLWVATRNAAEVRSAYEAGLQDHERWNRVETISAVLEMGADAEPFRAHFERLQSDPTPEVRDRAAKALHWLSVRR
jgi:HEAT repeat protein